MNNQIIDFMNMVSQYGLILDFNGVILHCNPPLQDVLQYPVSRLDEVFGNEAGSVLAKIQSAITSRSLTAIDVEIDFGDGIHPIFGQIYPLEIEDKYLAIMLFHPVDTLHRLENALFDRKSKLPTDCRWIIDENYKTLKFTADEDCIFNGRNPGFSLFEAIQEKDHNLMFAAFEKAILSPGEMITITVDAQRKHGICRVEADIIYLADMFYGNRYFVMTRPAISRTLHILTRMAEAYQVENDKDLAVCLGVVSSAISNVRTNNREMPDTWLVQCCLDCKIRFHWLYGGIGEKFFEG
ncbi:helix-turn-helix domain-containing protein [Maridesulfovibrio ferrireducens]|uniref:helix-turn-helix domain-containing protein n=1 Tax=Maridesulfovibrio ferrireducens TaxID=246191 RepID=UPI001A282418|nr:helix-turn-helix domain-containing protein [Maridesulfovibrio ferrireducens]MBI9112234.1 helix-turn-helix domain-containing protein [Maridesulfovibrio ferrireducens]